jgi:hypothetical protein
MRWLAVWGLGARLGRWSELRLLEWTATRVSFTAFITSNRLSRRAAISSYPASGMRGSRLTPSRVDSAAAISANSSSSSMAAL